MLHPIAFRLLYRYISNLETVDCHEHLYPELVRTAEPVDFSTLLKEYSAADLENAGLPGVDYIAFFSPDTDLDRKWSLLEPYLPAIETTSYYHAVCLALKKYYGESSLTKENYRSISEAMRRRNCLGTYETVLSDSRIRYALVSSFPKDVSPTQLSGRCLYVPMYYVPPGEESHGFLNRPTCLEDMEREADAFIALALQGARCVKIRVDYPWLKVDQKQAQEALDAWLTGREKMCPALCWYYVELLLKRCAEHNMPICMHTGYWNDFRNLSPEHLIPLIDSHPENRFDLFHLGYPYVDASLLLAKTRPNVCIDLCWVYLIGEQLARESIRKIVDMVPMNKVMGFGGDYWNIDNVYGHRKMMDRTMALALADRVADGTLTIKQAKRWASAMLWDNPAGFFGLQ